MEKERIENNFSPLKLGHFTYKFNSEKAELEWSPLFCQLSPLPPLIKRGEEGKKRRGEEEKRRRRRRLNKWKIFYFLFRE